MSKLLRDSHEVPLPAHELLEDTGALCSPFESVKPPPDISTWENTPTSLFGFDKSVRLQESSMPRERRLCGAGMLMQSQVSGIRQTGRTQREGSIAMRREREVEGLP
jgi:hypothetical protein